MATPPDWLFSAFSFSAFILASLPLFWQIKASGNVGACSLAIWSAVGYLNSFINSIIWRNNTVNWAPVWCDISSRVYLGMNVAISASSLCINRRLYRVSQVTSVQTTQTRRADIEDLCMTVGIPLLHMALYIIYQGHRFDIYEDIGCFPEFPVTPVSIVLRDIWPVIISIIAAAYGCGAFVRLARLKYETSKFLSANSHLTRSFYWRLMALAGTELLIGTPLSIFIMVWDIRNGGFGVQPYSWSRVHSNFSRVVQYPASYWKIKAPELEISRWDDVLSALIFFAFFGFSEDAQKNYRRFWNFLLAKCTILQTRKKSVQNSTPPLQIHPTAPIKPTSQEGSIEFPAQPPSSSFGSRDIEYVPRGGPADHC
ncbi:hypothetical protein JAAARDRAFT_580088 [Jaapia argillacea MUCL 33604]|uniref:Uncharacterized protein n=1 Tax=Jaapia argillacea MUCL 33604 TaxID=933084 RepID=A0A067PJD7_9AGAM|nr:hypothetical protein JAAARDRAFT_580088 [Jaapia argillacea MUCL 33604]